MVQLVKSSIWACETNDDGFASYSFEGETIAKARSLRLVEMLASEEGSHLLQSCVFISSAYGECCMRILNAEADCYC